MTNIEIKNLSGEVIFTHECASMREAVEKAVRRGISLRKANLSWANLHRANLQGASLDGANLFGANLRGANLYVADLRGANLRGANLRGANLYGANLYGADLRRADLDGETLTKTPLAISNLHYWVLISDAYMKIGCTRHTHEEWEAFSDDEISVMDTNALAFWKVWKEPLLAMCKAHKT